MARLINATPHDLHVFDADDTLLCTIPRSGHEFRLVEHSVPFAEVTVDDSSVTLSEVSYAAVDPPIPAPVEDTWWIVSTLVAEAARDRRDVLFPAGQVRDEKGRIKGCTHLGRLP
ncbi:MAG: hypothetical protein QM809_15345 [Gordonia sp. (in: high G+C Gram-positive bacteria)]|uniref:hypothetical protein n=1 Tax=Gordonia sp. (in: high G+C Gram-positive bacteria) TaxID=84139 RepID=UPI0039E2E04C